MLDKLSYDIHMVAEGMLQRGMIDVEAPGSVRVKRGALKRASYCSVACDRRKWHVG
jgi:hypothetical protein